MGVRTWSRYLEINLVGQLEVDTVGSQGYWACGFAGNKMWDWM